MMDRRTFIHAVVGGLIAAPLTVKAQQTGRAPWIGFLGNGNPNLSSPSVQAFRQGLRELGWIEGQNITIEYRWADGNMDRHPALAAELVKLPVDVLVTVGSPAVRAARQATSTIPIVAAIMSDPVGLGFAASLARPGGNVSGLSNQFEELVAKQLQIFKEVVPKAARVAMLAHPEMSPSVRAAAEAAARALGLDARVFEIRDVANLDVAFRAAKTERADGAHVLPSPFFHRHRARLAELAAKHGVPLIGDSREYVQDGGLMSYGPNFPGMHHRAAAYVDKILKGAKPGDLPIEQPTRFEFVINLKTAKALGLTIPQTVLLRADEVIQ